MLGFLGSLSYLTMFAFFQGKPRRATVPEALAKRSGVFKAIAWLGVISVFAGACYEWGGERGIPFAIGLISLAGVASVFLGTRFARLHCWSGGLAAVAAFGFSVTLL
ncbi:MAG: hypothetical protein AAGE43_06505 [Pseudomonadota bacterium]